MKLDIVLGLGKEYIPFNPENKEHSYVKIHGGIPSIIPYGKKDDESFYDKFVRLLEEYPDFVIQPFSYGKNKKIYEGRLADIISVEKIRILQKFYVEYRNYVTQISDFWDKGVGERPSQDETDVIDAKSAKMAELDFLVPQLEHQIARQHVVHSIDYAGVTGLPFDIFLDDKVLRVGLHNRGTHGIVGGEYHCEEYFIGGYDFIPADGGQKVFQVKRLKLGEKIVKRGDVKNFLKIFYSPKVLI